MKTAPTAKHELVIRECPSSPRLFYVYVSSNAAAEWVRKCQGYIDPVTIHCPLLPHVPGKLLFSVLPNYNQAEILEFITSKDFCEPYNS